MLQLCDKIKDLLSDLGQTPETFHRKTSILWSMFNDISLVTEKTTKMNAWQMAES